MFTGAPSGICNFLTGFAGIVVEASGPLALTPERVVIGPRSVRNQRRTKMNAMKLAMPFFFALVYLPATGWAAPILGSVLDSFAVLGSSTVTNTPTSAIVGNVGVWSSGGANAISGFNHSPGVAVSDPQVTGGNVHAGTAVAQSAQGELTTAITDLGLLGSGTTLINPDLSGLVLTPGVYTVHAGTSNLTTLLGALTLDGLGNANAVWVFQMDSTLITSPGSSVDVINTGSGAGVFWDVRSSAVIDTTTSFEGNILALTSVSLNTDATIGCGRALANTGAVTLDMNSIDIGCGGGLDVTTTAAGGTVVTILPFAAVPEPGTLLLFGLGLAGILSLRKKSLGIA